VSFNRCHSRAQARIATRSAGGHIQTSVGLLAGGAEGASLDLGVACDAPSLTRAPLDSARGSSPENVGLGGGKGGVVGSGCARAVGAVTQANSEIANARASAR